MRQTLIAGFGCLILLAGCSALPSPTASCHAFGPTVSISLPDGHPSLSAGCLDDPPYPGMDRPGHPDRSPKLEVQ